MGQYHYLVNLTKQEFVHPHRIGLGLKQYEQFGGFDGSMGDVMGVLLAAPEPRGGGDFDESPLLGRWHGDRVLLSGDYAEQTDLPASDYAEFIYAACGSSDSEFDREEQVAYMEEGLTDLRDKGRAEDEEGLRLAAGIEFIKASRFVDISDDVCKYVLPMFGIRVLEDSDGWKTRVRIGSEEDVQEPVMAPDMVIYRG